MSGKRGIDRLYQPSPMVSGGGLEKYRDRSPMEVVSDGYMAVTQVATLNAVTQLGMESLRQCDVKRQEVLADHPDLEAPLAGLLFNGARLIAQIQNSVANNDKRV
jgi:hypothetical protein